MGPLIAGMRFEPALLHNYPLSCSPKSRVLLQVVVFALREGLALLHNSGSAVYRVLVLQSTNAFEPCRPTRRCSRPLRARDRSFLIHYLWRARGS